jgi:UDP-2,4-diacetamido-2,4,6-trideoxy-beta-L-altropyranose hydrolase
VAVPSIAFRCDASLRIGSGHVMRCRTLARALLRRRVDIVFLCRRQPGDLIALLEQEFRVLVLAELPMQAPSAFEANPSGARALYASWLGCSEQQDAAACLMALKAAQLEPPAWLVLDHYGLGAPWQSLMQAGLGDAGCPDTQLLVLDDLADRQHQAAVLMDANRLDPAAPDPYRHLLPRACTTLLGPAYALLDPLYPQLQPLVPLRTQLARVLVFFGGVDAANHAADALRALCHPRLLPLAVDVVIGSGSPHRAALEGRVQERPNTNLHVGLPCLAGLMTRADLALGAAGTASWERACLGLPCLVVPVAENQIQGARALEAAGVARCLDLQTVADPMAILQAALLELLDAPDSLQAMSEACLQLGDGRGLARVVAALLGPGASLCLRPATPEDLWLYHWWASDPQVRRQSFKSDLIPLEQHRHWFKGRLSSSLALLRVLNDDDGLPLGQIRFERSAESAARAVIGFSLDRLARGRGLASQLLAMGLDELVRCWGANYETYGEVRADNSASCRAFLRAGFQEGPPPRQGVRCFSLSGLSAP